MALVIRGTGRGSLGDSGECILNFGDKIACGGRRGGVIIAIVSLRTTATLNSVFQLPFPSPRSILHKAAKHVDCFAHKSDYISPVRKTQTPYMAREAHILGSLPTSPNVFPPRLPLTPSAPVTLASFSSFELATLFSPSRHLCSRCISSLERIPARSSQVWPLLMVQVSTQTSPLRSCCPSQF